MKALKLALAASILALFSGVLIGKQMYEYKYFFNTPPIVVYIPHETVVKQSIRDVILTEYKSYNVSFSDADWIADNILIAEKTYQVPSNILLALIKVESSFVINSLSNKDAVGLTQVRPSVWKDEIEYNLYDPAQNILAGAQILRNYKNECGNWECALKAYNIGITNFKAGKQKKPAAQYVKKIKEELQRIDIAMYTPPERY